MEKNKHLDLDARVSIEVGLDKGESFKTIGKKLGKDCTTISREVRGHMQHKKTGGYGKSFNDCAAAHRRECTERHACERCPAVFGRRPCWSCGRCTEFCPAYERYPCPKLEKPPYVCNGCDGRRDCCLEKSLYSASHAQKEYESLLRESRSGFAISGEELARLDSVVSPKLAMGQSIHHIAVTAKDETMRSERSIYAYVNGGLLSAINLDMPRTVRMRPRKGGGKTLKVDRSCREGRTFADYEAFMAEHPGTPTVQMDSVEGVKGGAVLLTLHFANPLLQAAFKRAANDSRSVTEIFDRLYTELGPELFTRLFQVILTDNGSEFTNPAAIEFDGRGNRRARVFYCDPNSPFQKGKCENNHEMIRRCIPKGTDIGRYSQEQISLMMSHINSYTRPLLGDRTPYDAFAFQYGAGALDVLGIKRVPAEEVNLTPAVFR